MSPENAVWEKLIRVFTHVENYLAKAMLREHGLGLSEYRALQYLSAASRSELRMQELAEVLSLNQSSVARLVTRLEESQFTVRDACPDDKRGVYTVITELGKERYKVARLDYERFLIEALEDAGQMHNAKDIVGFLRKMVKKEVATRSVRRASKAIKKGAATSVRSS